MEPSIKVDSNIPSLFNRYITCLSKKVKSVCAKINFSYNGITWIIFDPSVSDIHGNRPNHIQKILVGRKGIDYGASNGKDTIWISTLSIDKEYCSYSYQNNKLLQNIGISSANNGDFLADVILDEIAHIVTGCDHGTLKYDKKLHDLRDAYYRNSVGSFLTSTHYKSRTTRI